MLRRFRPKLVPTLMMLAAVALTASLGLWQVRRYREQTAFVELYRRQHDLAPVATDLAPAAAQRLELLNFRRAKLSGVLDLAHAQLLTARYRFQKLGYVLIVPLSTSSGTVLANLGWLPKEKVAEHLATLRRSPNVELEGRLQRPEACSVDERPVGETDGLNTWLRPCPAALAKEVSALDRELMLQVGRQADGSVVNPALVPLTGYDYPVHPLPSKNVEYALTWFGILATAVAVWFALALQPKQPEPSPPTGPVV